MNTAAYFSAPKTLRRIHAGPLGPYVDEFASWLQEQHYSRLGPDIRSRRGELESLAPEPPRRGLGYRRKPA